MRENRLYGSEGEGPNPIGPPYPYRRLGILMIMNINGKISIVTLRSTPR
jgi:hypothetical protein